MLEGKTGYLLPAVTCQWGQPGAREWPCVHLHPSGMDPWRFKITAKHIICPQRLRCNTGGVLNMSTYPQHAPLVFPHHRPEPAQQLPQLLLTGGLTVWGRHLGTHTIQVHSVPTVRSALRDCSVGASWKTCHGWANRHTQLSAIQRHM